MTKYPKRAGRPTRRPCEEDFYILYDRFSIKQIARLYDVNESTVRRWLGVFRKEEKAKQQELRQEEN